MFVICDIVVTLWRRLATSCDIRNRSSPRRFRCFGTFLGVASRDVSFLRFSESAPGSQIPAPVKQRPLRGQLHQLLLPAFWRNTGECVARVEQSGWLYPGRRGETCSIGCLRCVLRPQLNFRAKPGRSWHSDQLVCGRNHSKSTQIWFLDS